VFVDIDMNSVTYVQLPYNEVDSIHLIVLGTIGFVETLIEVNESIGEATVNVNLRLNSSTQFKIMFFLFANTMMTHQMLVMLLSIFIYLL